MNTVDTPSVLNKLITLTSERDVLALEQSLAEALFELVNASADSHAKYVIIFHPDDTRKQLSPSIIIGKSAEQCNFSLPFKQLLIDCFKSGRYSTYEQDSESHVSLYPIKNAKEHTIAIIAIEAMVCESQLHEVITSLLKIYQNFSRLINDNERDTLTGLLNRKTFDYKINKILLQIQELARLNNEKANQVYFLAIFDIDHFKRVNDEFGHLIGDEVLLLFSQLMTQTFRNTDLIFRFGGEEFVGIFECSSYEDISHILNRFREKVGQFNFPQVGKMTVSIGYTEIYAYDLSSLLIDHADLALYFAKNNGRNKICFYEQLIADGSLQENTKETDIELF
ncbi:MAG: GGDEF domain-containing protein [Methylotenera sp.]|uniref:GGDEF domain-containing protein n=1 Tax=Methylotenera sp. TaxID=2051956 RepID=UPI0024878BC6|nr:GGDEF domain-containing protein [Methylotenera sp.]MDI1308215.1 GGDEF domain-containing protein [Methylotenera sp.]